MPVIKTTTANSQNTKDERNIIIDAINISLIEPVINKARWR
jgi:hypothetical protein